MPKKNYKCINKHKKVLLFKKKLTKKNFVDKNLVEKKIQLGGGSK